MSTRKIEVAPDMFCEVTLLLDDKGEKTMIFGKDNLGNFTQIL